MNNMLGRLYTQIRQSVVNIEHNVFQLLGGRYPPDAFCPVGVENRSKPVPASSTDSLSQSLESLLRDSILWAVPKSRRTIEKRLNRKFGWPDQVWKPIVPKRNLLMCNTCGNHHEAAHLCSTCYSRVKQETEEMHKVIDAELGLNPIDKEVVVLYQGEKEGVPEEVVKGKRIIEMKKERPSWFSKNLLERTTQPPSTSTSVKPTDLA